MEKRLPKRKVAILLGFSGTGYQGMQINPGAKTIEGDLFRALCDAGAVSKDNAVDLKKVSFMRACRTDKGVHAAGQVVSMKMIMEDPNIVERVNALLPKSIHIYDIRRTSNSFHAKENCDSRIYEYLIPSWIFMDNHVPESIKSERSEEPFIATMSDIPIQDSLKSYRISEEKKQLIQELLSMYCGTKNYHNFTIGKESKDASAKRHIKSFLLADVIIKEDGVEWLSLVVHGQSFMMHQIRKMVGLIVLMVRYNAAVEKFSIAFENNKLNIPKAPGEGLLLEKAIFEKYNLKFTEKERLDFDEFGEELKAFKNEFIYAQIFQKMPVFASWIKCLEEHFYEFKYLFQ